MLAEESDDFANNIYEIYSFDFEPATPRTGREHFTTALPDSRLLILRALVEGGGGKTPYFPHKHN